MLYIADIFPTDMEEKVELGEWAKRKKENVSGRECSPDKDTEETGKSTWKDKVSSGQV